MYSMYFVIMTFVAGVLGLVGAILGWSGLKPLLDPAVTLTNTYWAGLVMGLVMVAVAIVLALHLVNWRRRAFYFLKRVIDARRAYRLNQTPENEKAWGDAKFTFDLHLGRVELTAGALRFDQPESLTTLGLPPGFGDGPTGPSTPPSASLA